MFKFIFLWISYGLKAARCIVFHTHIIDKIHDDIDKVVCQRCDKKFMFYNKCGIVYEWDGTCDKIEKLFKRVELWKWRRRYDKLKEGFKDRKRARDI